MAQNKLVEATVHLIPIHMQKEANNANYWLNWAAALRGLRWTVAPYRILQRALCYEPSNEDVQEALTTDSWQKWAKMKQSIDA